MMASSDPIGARESFVIDEICALLKARWAAALKTHQWQQVAFFLQEAKDKKLLQPGVLSLVKSISLASVGAQSEALAEMQDAMKDLAPKSRDQTCVR